MFWTSLSDLDSGKLVNGNALQSPYTDKYTLPSIKVQAALEDVKINAISSQYFPKGKPLSGFSRANSTPSTTD